MVIPIFPNTHHPRGRPPIRPETPFPFPNCYHWIENDATVRIRRKDEQYDDTNAVKLSAMQHVMIDIGFSDDYKRIDDFLDGQAEGDEGTAGIDDGAATISSPAPTPPRPVSRTSQPSRLSAHLQLVVQNIPTVYRKARSPRLTLTRLCMMRESAILL